MYLTSSSSHISFKALSFFDKIKFICILYLSVWMTSPFLAYGTIYRIFALLAIGLWVFLEFFEKRTVIFKPTSYILLLYIFLFYTMSVSYLADGVSILIRNIQFYLMLFYLLVYASYQRKSLNILRPIVYINIFLFTIWMLTTYIALLENGHASRYVIRSGEEAMELTKKGVGGFTFIYSLLIYIISVLALIKNRLRYKRLLNSITLFLIASVILAMLVVLKAEYSTAVLLMVLSVVFFLFYSDSIQKNIVLFFVMLLIFIALKFYMIDILKMLLPYAEGTNYSHKILDSISSIETGQATGTAEDRVERYIRSWNLFLEHPLVGVWSFRDIGKHSMILDTFAQFGFFGGVALLYILLKVPIELYKKASKSNKVFTITILFLIIALSSLNNVSMAYGFMFYIFYPVILYRLEHE